MKDGELDSTDRHILYYLQQDARSTSSSDIAEKLGLSASTVRTRLNKLESSGVVRGYHIDIDYDLAGYPLYTKIICTAPVPRRDELADRARDIRGVTAVREIMTGERNVYVNAIGRDHDDLDRITKDVDAIGLDVIDEQLIRDEYICPYHGFLDPGEEPVLDDDSDADGDDDSHTGRDDDGDT
ncbi:Lrp/AsnC family transcriptional regulator [Halobaculum limi]|uniref:Lrp/AsnC family transcriptional regulator n=1 Tax=Halobaculum limi TaxID=3031916 RepID=UPI0024053D66|nr:Lrp/AsnC family transcriptional regulator [Halobaculum sp. YSMS11]